MQSNNPLKIEQLEISALKPNPRNARKHPQKQIAKLAANMKRFGFPVPVLIDQNNMLVAGHGRLEAAKQIGLTHIPAVRKSFASAEERSAYALADNRLAELSTWDEDNLRIELEFCLDADIEIEATGFEMSDLDFDFEIVNAEPAQEAAKAENVELPSEQQKAVTQPGDLWKIGEHRLLCGDAREALSYEALMAGECADIVFDDPPYNVPINGHVSGTGHHREFAFASGAMSPGEFTQFLRSAFRQCTHFSRAGSIHYHCMDWRHIREILDAADGIYDEFKQLIVWKKTNGAMGTFYRSQHELVFVFKSGAAKHVNNFGLGETGRYRTNVVEYAGCNTFRKGRAADLEAHSTVKPTAMVADFLLDCSHRGDLVLDPFLGSGTTLLAAHKTGRRGRGMEIDPLYCDTALKRLQSISGIEPVLEATGETFSKVMANRLSSDMEGLSHE